MGGVSVVLTVTDEAPVDALALTLAVAPPAPLTDGEGEVLRLREAVMLRLGLTLPLNEAEGVMEGEMEVEGVMEDEKEGCAGPTKTVLPLVATTPVQLASSKQVLVKVWKTKAVVLTVVAFCCLVTFWKMVQQAETLALTTPAG